MSVRDSITVGGVMLIAGLGLGVAMENHQASQHKSPAVVVATSVRPVPTLSAFEAAVLAVPAHRRNFYPPDATRLRDTADRLELAAQRLGVTIAAEEPDEGNFGQITYSTRVMRLDSALKGDARVMVKAHELAHLLQPAALEEHGDREMFAEATAYMVVGREADYTVALAEYAARHKTSLSVLSVYREEIQFAARFLRGSE